MSIFCKCGKELEVRYCTATPCHYHFHTIKVLFCRGCGVREIKVVSKNGCEYI